MFSAFVRFFLIFSVAIWPFGQKGRDVEIKETSLALPSDPSAAKFVRVALLQRVKALTVETDSPYRVSDGEGRPLFDGKRIVRTQIRSHPAGIQFGTQTFQRVPLTIESQGESGIKVGDRLYRDALKIWRETNGTLSVVNIIPIEDYLKGVMTWEANPKWPAEALKAQAIASRTYALFKVLENRDARFDLSKGTMSQIYGGKQSENKITSRAVDATRGQILMTGGKIFPAYFHSTCGGATTHAEYLWDVKPHPSLQGVLCPFCQESKHYRWKEDFSFAFIGSRLKKAGWPVTGIRKIEPVEIDASGRARAFRIFHENGRQEIHANDFRIAMDPAKFKSTKDLVLHAVPDGLIVRGRGWGHGVGMCQYGMKRMAELGYRHDQILQFYYPGSEIKQLDW